MKTDIQIAQEAVLEPISDVAASLGLDGESLIPYGKYKAKVDHRLVKKLAEKKDAKVILVTAISPTPAGEGKTTTSVGLADALHRMGKNVVLALREPSLGPVFGVKGGAAGGGYAQVVPMEDINLHFTGDLHAIGAANNLLAAMVDNHIYQGNALNIDPRRITWKRCVDMNDRQLRFITDGLGGKANGTPREDGFDITVASEVMAIFCLATDLADLKARLGRIVVGYTYAGAPVTAEQIGEAWLNYIVEDKTILWWGGLARSTEHSAYLRLKAGIKPPLSGSGEKNGMAIAEQIGVISDVTRFMLDRACAFVRSYRDAHPNTSFRGVSVNFSAVQFIQDDLAESVLAVVARHGIPASCLRVEVTESAIIANPEAVRAFMGKMHARGVRFYLDDFGTGYSNLSTLLELPFDVVKLDKSILWSVTEDERLVEFFALLASGFGVLGTQALSEGVETPEQRAFLDRCGCDLMQGYLFSRPLPPEKAAAAIATSEGHGEE